jgi:integrase
MPGLTERDVRAARAKKVELFVWDGQLPGFGVRVKPPSAKNPDGVKTFLVQYRVGHQTRRVKIGRHPAFRVEQARTRAMALLGEISSGGDPSLRARRARTKQGDTVEAVGADFIERYAKAKGRRSWKETERIFKVYVCPKIGRRPIRDVKRRDIIELLDNVGAINGPIMANRVLAAVRKLFNWAIGRDIIEASPIVGIERPGEEKSRDRVLTDGEIREVWNAAEALGYPYGHLTKALLLTGQRRGEVARMRRVEIDSKERVWTIPSERTKNKLPHEVPLFSALSALLTSIPLGGDYMFKTGRIGDKPVNSFTLAKQRLDTAILVGRQKEAEAKGGQKIKANPMPNWTFHDLRRTMRTRLSKLGIDAETAERVIGHVPAGVRAVYDRHEFREEKRKALALWGQSLASIIEPSGKVVVLSRDLRQRPASRSIAKF